MTGEFLLAAGVLASVSTSLLLWSWLRLPLKQLLGQLCGQPGSTEFWSRYMMLMLVIAPLATVIALTPLEPGSTLDAARRTMLVVLLGQFAAFALVGRGLFKAVRRASEQEVGSRPQPTAKE